jgi:hypothetical protein
MASILSAGTTSATAMVHTADTSGVLQLASNNGVVAVTIDTSQNVGVGVTPSAWGSSNKAIDVGGKASFAYRASSGLTAVASNLYIDASDNFYFKSNGIGSLYQSGNGFHYWYYTNNNSSGANASVSSLTNAMTLDASGNLGVGTAPSYRLHVVGTGAINSRFTTTNNAAYSTSDYAAISTLIIGNSSTTASSGSGITFTAGGSASGSLGSIAYVSENSGYGGFMAFQTRSVAGADTERARIDSSGRMLVGASSFAAYGTLNAYSNSAFPAGRFAGGPSLADGSIALMVDKYSSTNTTSQWFLGFTISNTGTASGVITANGASQAAFGAWSDRRLKENIVDLPPQLANIMALRPVEFDYIASEGGGHQISFIAQEFEQVYPDAVGERQDGMKTLTGWAKTEARLVKAIQEQQAIIQQLQADVSALKGA